MVGRALINLANPRFGSILVHARNRVFYIQVTMATSSKQFKAIGEDIWKSRTEKIVRSTELKHILLLMII